MNQLLATSVTVIAVIVFLQIVVLLVTTNRLLKLQLWVPRKTPCSRSASGDLQLVLNSVRTEMEQAGFRYMHSWRERSLIFSAGRPASYCDVYHHLAQDVHAEVYPSESLVDQHLCDIHFWNTYVDGRALLTVNSLPQTMVPYPGRISVIADKSKTVAGQLASHLHVRELITVQRTDPEDAPQIAQNLAERWLVRLEREGTVYQRSKQQDEAIYGFRFFAALTLAWNLRRTNFGKSSKPRKPITKVNTSNADANILAAEQIRDRFAFVRSLCTLNSLQAPRWYQAMSFTFSALAFLALGIWWWGVTGALVIGAIIVLHEGGHWLAMQLAGFRDVQVFFVPGMGGLTSGEKHEANPLTHLLVYLAGPMPGLILSICSFALFATNPILLNTAWAPYITMAALASLLVNGFNLLPMLPLDGGRVIDLLLIARFPWLRFGFSVISGVLLVANGWYTGDRILPGIGILMLIGARFQYKLAKASALLLKNPAHTVDQSRSFSQAAGELFDFFRHTEFSQWPYANKLSIGQALLPRYLGRLPGWKESTAGMAIYLACIIMPLAALGTMLYVSPSATLTTADHGISALMASTKQVDIKEPSRNENNEIAVNIQEEKQHQRQVRAEKINAAQGQDRAATLKAAFEEANEFDPEDALRIAKIYYAENNNSVQATYEHADAAFDMAISLGNWSEQDDAQSFKRNGADIANYLQEAEAILRTRLQATSDKKDARLLANVLQFRDIDDPDSPPQIALKKEVVALFAKDKEPGDMQLMQAHQLLAHAYYRSGNVDEAEDELKTARNDYDCSTKNVSDHFCNLLKLDQAWFLVNKKKFDEAKALVAPLTIKDTRTENASLRQDVRQLRWMIAMLQKDFNTAKQEAMASADVNRQSSGSWLRDLYLLSYPLGSTYPSDLMLVESLRALGEHDEANRIAERLIETQRKAQLVTGKNKTNASNELICSIDTYGSAWKGQLQQNLLAIEQRETHCKPRSNQKT